MNQYNPVTRTTEVTFQCISQLLLLLCNLLQPHSQQDLKQNKQKKIDCCLHSSALLQVLSRVQQAPGPSVYSPAASGLCNVALTTHPLLQSPGPPFWDLSLPTSFLQRTCLSWAFSSTEADTHPHPLIEF